MSRSIVFLTFLSSIVLIFPNTLQAKVWVVNANGTGDFTTLSAAIDSAASSDTIFVAAGGYVESPSATTKKLAILGIGFSSPTVTTWSITLNGTLSLGAGSLISGLELKGSADPLIKLSYKSIAVEKCHLVVDGFRSGISIEADSCLVRQSIVQSVSSGGQGIKTVAGLSAVRILNNIVANFATGIHVVMSEGDDEIVANNILLKNSSNGLSIGTFVSSTETFFGKFYSNILLDNGSGYNHEGNWGPDGQFYFGYNNFYGNLDANIPTFDVGSIMADPAFANYSSTTGYGYGTTDLHLGESSPCIDTGEPNVGNNDRDGSRNDMGIYGGPDQFDDTGAPIYPAVITVVVSPYSAPLNGTITIKVLGRIGQ